MNQTATIISRALISVSDKTGIVEFARGLHMAGVEILSTGGTAKCLRDDNIPVTDVATVTGFPEMMEGRVKTLHPAIHGGILGLRDKHAKAAAEHGIDWIDLVVVNLYPFAKTIQKENVTLDEAQENIDIGGPSMIRSAAKNTSWVGVVVDPGDYKNILAELKESKSIFYKTRQLLSAKAFAHTAHYDAVIAEYMDACHSEDSKFSPKDLLKNISGPLAKKSDLRYGENPHQQASVWQAADHKSGLLNAEIIQGKPLSYNNIVDADAAFECAKSFTEQVCVIVKHATPCGIAVGSDAFKRALACDSVSAFGGIVAFNKECTVSEARAIIDIFMEVVIAPSFSADALATLAKKPNMRVLQVDFSSGGNKEVIKQVSGGFIIQSLDNYLPTAESLKCATDSKPSKEQVDQLLFAYQVAKFVKSNAIVIANNNSSVGIGGGQVSRVDAVQLALQKAGSKANGAVLASDAFFPFKDSIELLEVAGIKAIIQPGGSIKDDEVIAACNSAGIVMVFTGKRCFRH